jgi:hypothetical protein
VLDILRNNSRLEALYAMATSRACQFCLAYRRTTEFRRLCDIVRNHLSQLLKYRDQGGRDRTDLGCGGRLRAGSGLAGSLAAPDYSSRTLGSLGTTCTTG